MLSKTENLTPAGQPSGLSVIAGYALFVFPLSAPRGGMADFKGIFFSREEARGEFCELCKNYPHGAKITGHISDMTTEGTEILAWHNASGETRGPNT